MPQILNISPLINTLKFKKVGTANAFPTLHSRHNFFLPIILIITCLSSPWISFSDLIFEKLLLRKVNIYMIKSIYIRLQDALNRPAQKQFERVIVKKGTTIIGEGDGTHNECTEALLNIPGMFDQLMTRKAKNLELYHSHPDIFGKGRTAPLSSPNGGDLSAFRHYALKKIVAINSNGEFNSIERGQNFSNKNFHLFADGMDEYISKKVFGKLFGKLQKLLDKIEEYQSKNLKIPEELIKKRDITIGKMDKIEQTFRNSEKVEKFVHEYYQKANQFGMIYSTNFSNLI